MVFLTKIVPQTHIQIECYLLNTNVTKLIHVHVELIIQF